MYSLALTINTHGPLGASTYTVVRARLRLNTRGQPGIPTRPFSLCALLAPRQIHDAGRPFHVLPMAIHRSVREAKGAGCGRLPGTVVASGSSGSSASLRKMRRDFIPPRRCPSTPHPRLVFASACPVTCVGVCIPYFFGCVHLLVVVEMSVHTPHIRRVQVDFRVWRVVFSER